MLLKGLILASYTQFSGGQFGELFSQWEQMGVFSYMLPFLLIFAIIYGILNRLKVFGDKDNKSINAIISLVVALMALQFGAVTVFFQDIFPRLGIALAGILVFIILMGLFANPKNKSLHNTLMWVSFGVAILIVLMSLNVFEGSSYGDYILNFIPYSWLPWIAIIVLIVIVVSSAKGPSKTEPAGIFVKGLEE